MVSQKCTLSFNLDDHEGREAAKRAMKALDLAMSIWDILQYMRQIDKYGLPEGMVKLSNAELVSCIRDRMYDLLEENDINISELIS